MSIKQKIERFHQWQRKGIQFSYNKDEKHHCHCCGEEFTGNFCPACGQRHDLGVINWAAMRNGVLDVWGLGGRSLPRTLWHLILRPGYLIGDYISGKRQVSFPPVKMLVLVALIIFILINIIDPSFSNDEGLTTDTLAANADVKVRYLYYIDKFFSLLESHFDWTAMLLLSFLLIPTWVVFRYAPSHDHHTLPQGFYIQVFNSTAALIIFFFVSLLFYLPPKIQISDDYIGIVFIVLLFLQLLRTYKQLFDYSWWGTIWRLLVSMVAGVALILLVFLIMRYVVSFIYSDWTNSLNNVSKVLLFVLCIIIPLGGAHMINKKTARKRLASQKCTE